MSLASPPGAQRKQTLPLQLWSSECQSLLLRGRVGADIRVPLPFVVLLGWWEPLLWVVGGGPALWMPLWLEGRGHRLLCHWYLLTCVCEHHGSWEPQGIWPSLLLLPGSLGLQAQPEWLGARSVGITCAVVLVLCSSPPTFRYMDIWIFWHPECVGQSFSVELWMFNWLLIKGERQKMHLNPPWCWYQYHYLFWFVFGHILLHVELLWLRDQELNPCPHSGSGKSYHWTTREVQYHYLFNKYSMIWKPMIGCKSLSWFSFLKIFYLSIWLHWVLAVTRGIFTATCELLSRWYRLWSTVP